MKRRTSLFGLFLVTCFAAFAQSDRGVITRTVSDPSTAVNTSPRSGTLVARITF
jgi:hypothetical protein